MRELTNQEITSVSGGLEGTLIPFTGGSKFIRGANWPGGASGAVAGAAVAYELGYALGERINWYNQHVTGMTLGVAIYRSFNGGSKLGGGVPIRIPVTSVEDL